MIQQIMSQDGNDCIARLTSRLRYNHIQGTVQLKTFSCNTVPQPMHDTALQYDCSRLRYKL